MRLVHWPIGPRFSFSGAEDKAKELGVSRKAIIGIENDKYNTAHELAMKIAKFLDLHVDEIFF